jgi:hypothetical protein
MDPAIDLVLSGLLLAVMIVGVMQMTWPTLYSQKLATVKHLGIIILEEIHNGKNST